MECKHGRILYGNECLSCKREAEGKQLKFTKGATFEMVVKDGFKQAEESESEGFEYTVGKVKGGELKVIFEPDCSHERVMIDGVDGFGYALAFEE